MSHSTVLVIGHEPEELLAPYDENKEVESYWTDEYESPGEYWRTADLVTQGKLPPNPSMQNLLDFLHAESEGTDEYRISEGMLQRRTTYNPLSKWDWYAIGGRWRGYLHLKEGLTNGIDEDADGFLSPPHWSETINGGTPREFTYTAADSALKRYIDIEGMRASAVHVATKTWEQFEDIDRTYGPLPVWSEVAEKYGQNMVKEAREDYQAHPGIIALHKAELIWFMAGWEEEFKPYNRVSYLAKAWRQALPGYAMLTKDGWMERGHMGWFGMSDDTVESTDAYLDEANRIIDEASDDELFTVVDVHI